MIVHNSNKEMLRYIHRSLLNFDKGLALEYIERFRVENLAKIDVDKNEYYAALKVITPTGFSVSS